MRWEKCRIKLTKSSTLLDHIIWLASLEREFFPLSRGYYEIIRTLCVMGACVHNDSEYRESFCSRLAAPYLLLDLMKMEEFAEGWSSRAH